MIYEGRLEKAARDDKNKPSRGHESWGNDTGKIAPELNPEEYGAKEIDKAPGTGLFCEDVYKKGSWVWLFIYVRNLPKIWLLTFNRWEELNKNLDDWSQMSTVRDRGQQRLSHQQKTVCKRVKINGIHALDGGFS